jgi:hypothetical protein
MSALDKTEFNVTKLHNSIRHWQNNIDRLPKQMSVGMSRALPSEGPFCVSKNVALLPTK